MSKLKPKCFGCNGQGFTRKEKLIVNYNTSKYHLLAFYSFQLKNNTQL